MAASNQRHVVHHPKGGWAVETKDAQRVSSRHSTKEQAQTRAKEILSHGGGGEAVTHRTDGSVSQSETVGVATVDWSLLSPQGHVLFFIGLCPDCTAKDIGRAIGHSPRQIWGVIHDLKEGDMLKVRKSGREHHFTINLDAPMLHPTIQGLSLRGLMEGAIEHAREADSDICD